MTSEQLDKWIERFKQRFEMINDELRELDEIRQREFNELNRRITTLEYAYARLYEDQNK